MHFMNVLYPNKEGAKFDFEYYMQRHIPLANGLLGREFKVSKGIPSPEGGEPPFVCIARMDVGTLEEFLPVITQHVAALQQDIPNYTNIEPVIQFEEVL